MSLPVLGKVPVGVAAVVVVGAAVVLLVQGGAVVELVDDGPVVLGVVVVDDEVLLDVELVVELPSVLAKDWIETVVDDDVLLDVDELEPSEGPDVDDVLVGSCGHSGSVVDDVVADVVELGAVVEVVVGHGDTVVVLVPSSVVVDPGAVVVLDPGDVVVLDPPSVVVLEPSDGDTVVEDVDEVELDDVVSPHGVVVEVGAVVDVGAVVEVVVGHGDAVVVLVPSSVVVDPGAVVLLDSGDVVVLDPPSVVVLEPSDGDTVVEELDDGALDEVVALHGSVVDVGAVVEVVVEHGGAVVVLEPSSVVVLDPGDVVVLEPSSVVVLDPGDVVVLDPPSVVVLEPSDGGTVVEGVDEVVELHGVVVALAAVADVVEPASGNVRARIWSLPPPLLVATHRVPSAAASTARNRPWSPSSRACGSPAEPSSFNGTRHSRLPRRAAT